MVPLARNSSSNGEQRRPGEHRISYSSSNSALPHREPPNSPERRQQPHPRDQSRLFGGVLCSDLLPSGSSRSHRPHSPARPILKRAAIRPSTGLGKESPQTMVPGSKSQDQSGRDRETTHPPAPERIQILAALRRIRTLSRHLTWTAAPAVRQRQTGAHIRSAREARVSRARNRVLG